MKKLLKCFVFTLIFIVLANCMHAIFKFKYVDGIEPLEEFYKFEEDSFDVMFFGSSHMFFGVNPTVLWREQGIRSYVLGGSMQPFWNTYYYIREALKYQTPKVIVLDVFMANDNSVFSNYDRIIKNTLGLKPSADKIEAIKISSPEENWLNLFLEFPTYHYRYKELTKRDFQFITGRDTVYGNGYYKTEGVELLIQPDVADVTEERALSDKNMEYLEKIIMLAREADVSLLFVVLPYQTTEENQGRYNTISRLAAENQVEMINYNLMYEELSLSFTKHFVDHYHLNNIGAEMVTSHLGDYLKEHFNLEDKRENPAFNNWHLWESALVEEE